MWTLIFVACLSFVLGFGFAVLFTWTRIERAIAATDAKWRQRCERDEREDVEMADGELGEEIR